jgi:hypothetical protein
MLLFDFAAEELVTFDAADQDVALFDWTNAGRGSGIYVITYL